MSKPEPAPHDAEEDNDTESIVPPAPPGAPAYSTPPPKGIPDAEEDNDTESIVPPAPPGAPAYSTPPPKRHS